MAGDDTKLQQHHRDGAAKSGKLILALFCAVRSGADVVSEFQNYMEQCQNYARSTVIASSTSSRYFLAFERFHCIETQRSHHSAFSLPPRIFAQALPTSHRRSNLRSTVYLILYYQKHYNVDSQ